MSTEAMGNDHPADKAWILDVQGERFEWSKPEVTVSEALERAGYSLSQKWITTLKIGGEPKRSVGPEDIIDLTHPGLERLRVLKGEVNNGDAELRRDFKLLPKDDVYLDGLGILWETVQQGSGRWLLLRNYPLPEGYNHTVCAVAIAIPPSYPAARLDMFFCAPHLARSDGKVIAQTQVQQTIDGMSFQRWSRHPTAPWNAEVDSVRTHMALVDESIFREVEK